MGVIWTAKTPRGLQYSTVVSREASRRERQNTANQLEYHRGMNIWKEWSVGEEVGLAAVGCSGRRQGARRREFRHVRRASGGWWVRPTRYYGIGARIGNRRC